MPELPDVEGRRRLFADRVAGRRIERVSAPDADVLRNTSPQGLGRALAGRRFDEPRRHGKWLMTPTVDGPEVVWHFGMTGEFVWADRGDDRHRHDRAAVVCDGGELRLRMMRKLGGVWLVRAGEDAAAVTGELGPDALGISREAFGEALAGRRGGVKAALMDQRVVAGPGNLVVDETLWHARLHPRRRVGDLSEGELRELHRSLGDVLRDAVAAGRVPRRDDWLTGVRDDGSPSCPRCGGPLERGTVGQRSTVWCPACQG